MNSEKYFLAIIPSHPVADYVNNYRRQYDENSLDSIPPHITVYPPFYLSNSESELINKLNNIEAQTSPFRVSFTSVDFFTSGNNVAFFKPDLNSTIQLRNLYKKTRPLLLDQIIDVWPNYPSNSEQYIPHCTIAEHISNDEFLKVKQNLESLSVNQSFDVSSVFLLKRQQGKWSPLSQIKFNGI